MRVFVAFCLLAILIAVGLVRHPEWRFRLVAFWEAELARHPSWTRLRARAMARLRALTRRRLPAPILVAPQRYSWEPAEGTYTRVSFDPGPDAGGELATTAERPVEWRTAMAAVGRRFRQAGVGAVVVVHGTFVGDDPLALAASLGRFAPRLGARWGTALRRFTRDRSAKLLRDNANFDEAYVRILEEALDAGVPVRDLVWSSENHHVGRVHGAVRLLRALRTLVPAKGPRRVLLIGHSHAGQLFALTTHLLTRAHGTDVLLRAASLRGEDVASVEADIEALSDVSLDFVTLGTPPRYGWATSPRVRVLHIVNHRGDEPRARGLSGLGLAGILRTTGGDYVHQVGIAGSDFPAVDPAERALNRELDGILGAGSNVAALLSNVNKGLRVAQHGHTYLVDYADAGARSINFAATVFGHGVYTRRATMFFHARLVADHFYPEPVSWRSRAASSLAVVARERLPFVRRR